MTLAAKPKVVVGMSGGVDSSMAAALLKEEGYDVIGVTLQIWDPTGPEVEGGCCSNSAIDDARRVAFILGIPHYVMNFRSYFKETVVDYFTQSYFYGETPNPCLACNRHVKFGEMLRKARGLGAEFIATGHYAQVLRDPNSERFLLSRSADQRKDQTYALYMLTQEQLKHTLFPLADYKKEHIREMARERGLGVGDKPESQEICFIPDDDYASFLKERSEIPIKPGDFVDLAGKKLGRHEGIIHFTVGQRKGLGVTFGKPMFVVGLNPERNEVVLGEDKDVFTDTLWAEDLNWISIPELTEPIKVHAKIRYNSSGAPATIIPGEIGSGYGVMVQFDEPQRAVTPGQAVVFYQGNLVVGGGKIISDPRGRDRGSKSVVRD
ncbi:tRNA 2-thiouridine(34) synthase MnmA [Desulfosporosinus meridiei]|uniref:tRNA-specific 2-thiouridylase MnmA n=1 Tax=Desulfosporosinus meridiei (strain ATCC BAA-275 / DSM 13257 / KCTC 12902 / NCIMB 13706 / S10) TaxID=768704 RepID=J7IW98_DESMD|nr:tRNA 2-thiouridine(34) synthase MnmA [Desulfosporosinus meridiei]AFQ42981.1 tRNA (5-methylaminomethyl-2-thiouridylate)-methyltransferase [Desulfosporosinus meridiei DSM 13257]